MTSQLEDELGEAVNYGWTVIAQYGDQTLWGEVSVEPDKVIEFLHACACENLPPGTRYQIRKRIPGFYGRAHGMAWYHKSSMAQETEWPPVMGDPIKEVGYLLVQRAVTPEISSPFA